MAGERLSIVFLTVLLFASDLRGTEDIGKNTKPEDLLMLPTFDKGLPTHVTANAYIVSFDSVNAATMDFKIMMYLRLQWNDPRLAFKFEDIGKSEILISSTTAKKFWFPDIFFINEEGGKIHVLLQPNQSWRLMKNGTVLTSTRLSLTLGCDMDLRNFPLDTQICKMELESYSFPISALELFWRQKPVVLRPGLEIPQYDLVGIYPHKYMESYGIMGNFSILKASFVLRRQIGYYAAQVFLPSILTVVLSWVSFWINFESVPARITIGLLTILTMTTLSSGINNQLPKVSYIKCIDIWLSVCLSLVFCALVEFAIVNTFQRSKSDVRVRVKGGGEPYKNDGFDGEGGGEEDKDRHAEAASNTEEKNYQRIPEKMDMVSRGLFPVLFVIFNFWFWIYYTSNYYKNPAMGEKNIVNME